MKRSIPECKVPACQKNIITILALGDRSTVRLVVGHRCSDQSVKQCGRFYVLNIGIYTFPWPQKPSSRFRPTIVAPHPLSLYSARCQATRPLRCLGIADAPISPRGTGSLWGIPRAEGLPRASQDMGWGLTPCPVTVPLSIDSRTPGSYCNSM